ncbi:MAG: TonB-dependent receptor [Rikenellaceae bacterium]
MLREISIGLMAIAAISHSHLVMAEEFEREIDSVVISSRASRSTAKESTPKQTLTQSKIELLGMNTLTDAVKTFSGVTIKDYGGIGGIKSVSIRSLGAEHTAIIYDGVAVSNTQGGAVDISSISLDDVEELSLTIGQGDDIFQAARNFASSGVLSIRSAEPRFSGRDYRIGLTYEMGSFATYNPQLYLAYKLSDRWSISSRTDWMLSDGDYPFTLENGTLITEEIRSNSDVNTIKSEMSIFGRVGTSGRLILKGNFLDSERGLPGSVILYNDYANERTWERQGTAQANYENRFNKKWAIKSAAKYNYNWSRYDSDYNTARGTTDLYTQQEYYASSATEYRPAAGWSITLAEDIFFNSLSSTAADGAEPERLSSLTAAAAQYMGERLTISATALYTHAREWTSGNNGSSPNRDHLSPALSLSYKLLKESDLRLRASFKDSFRLPTFNDLYYTKMGNNNLSPEKAKQYNIGLGYVSGVGSSRWINYLSLTADGYYNRVEDKIIAIPTMFYWTTINRGLVKSLGADINGAITLRLGSRVRSEISATYSYQHSVDKTDSESSTYNCQLPYTPVHSGGATATLMLPWFDLGYTLTAVGERYSKYVNSFMYQMDPYTDQNISISREFKFASTSLKLRAEVLNIANTNYSVIQYYPMPGRNYRLTITYNI